MEDLDYIQFKLEHGRVSLLRLLCVSKHLGVKISFSFRSKFQTEMYLSLNIVLSKQMSMIPEAVKVVFLLTTIR